MSNFGMYWYMSKKNNLSDEIRDAVKFYQDRYHKMPIAVHLNPKDIGTLDRVDGLPVRADKTVIKGNLFVIVSQGGVAK